VPTNRFIPVDEIKDLTTGSYEHVIAVVERAVQENAEGIFGKQIGVRLLGTFPTYAVALSEDGDLAKVAFERADDGAVKIVRHEAVELRSFSPDRVEDYAREQARKAVAAWEAGRVEEAQKIVSSLALYVGDRPQARDEDVVESLVTAFQAQRPWKQLFEERQDHFRKAVSAEELAELDRHKLNPKFAALYNGTISEDRVARYDDVVRSDLAYLSARVESLRDLASSSYEAIRSVIRSEDLKEASVSTLALFAEDLVSDLRRLNTVVTESAKKLTKTDCLGRLHDVIAEGLYEYEVAGRFVSAMSKRLCEAST
jgi:hypothetical protein